MDALKALVRKDLILYFSNTRALLITLAAPILIAAFFGSVMGGPPRKPSRVPIAVVDLDRSAISAGIVAAIRADPAFELHEAGEADAIAQVRAGKIRAAAVMPKGFGESAVRALFDAGAPKADVAVHYDPSQAIVVSIVRGLLIEHVVRGVSQVAAGSAPGGPAKGFSMPFTMTSSEAAAGNARAYNGYAHSFAGMSVQFILFMGIELGVGVLLMRRLGIWKRLRAAPVSRALLLGSRIASGTLIALALLAGIYAAAIAVFGVRIEGSVAGFVGVAIAFALLASTFGLLIAAIGKTPEATRGIAIVATLLLVMLGGAWVPTFVFPEWMQAATLVVPTRWAVDGLDAMTWRGLGIEAALGPIAAMLGFSALFAWIAVKRFAWEE